MTFAPSTIYRDLIRMVHPDLHPEMKEAVVRSQQVNAVKGDIRSLRRLAINWGFIKPTANDDEIRPIHIWENVRTPFTRRSNLLLNVGEGVNIIHGVFAGCKGVIVEITPIRQGKYHGYKKYTLYVLDKRMFTNITLRDYDVIQSYFSKIIIGQITSATAITKWKEYKIEKGLVRVRNIQELKLTSNRDYSRLNIKIRISLSGRVTIHKVLRTTQKCVIIDYYGTEKTVRVKNIIGRI
jgi:hypothetical protein